MWVDISWDNYILPIQNSHDYWNGEKYFPYSKFWVIGLCIVMPFLCFTYQKKKKKKTTQLQLVLKNSFQELFPPSSPAHQNSSRWQIIGLLSWYRLVHCLQLLDFFFFLFPLDCLRSKAIISPEKVHWRKAKLHRRIDIPSGEETQSCKSH